MHYGTFVPKVPGTLGTRHSIASAMNCARIFYTTTFTNRPGT